MGKMNIFSELGSAKRGGAARLGKQFAQKAKGIAAEKVSFQKRADAQLTRSVAKAAGERNRVFTAAKTQADKAAADKNARNAATRRANADHKAKLARVGEVEDLKTQKQVDRVKALAKTKAELASKSGSSDSKKTVSASRKTASGVSTDKDGVLKPAVSKNKSVKPTSTKRPGPKLNVSAGEAYND
jgi:hypothetical protein